MTLTNPSNSTGLDDQGRIGVLLKRRFLIFLLSLGACSVAAYIAFGMLTAGQDRLASLINDVGRQRMLAARIATSALRLPMAATTDDAAEHRVEMLRNLALMEEVFHSLPARAEDSRLQHVVTALMDDPSDGLKQTFAKFRARVTAIAESPDPQPAEIEAMVTLALGDLMRELEALVSALGIGGQGRAQDVQALAAAGEVVYLFLLLILGARVLWPLSDEVQGNVRQIIDLEHFQRSIVDGLADGLVLLGEDGQRGEPLNPAARDIFGLGPQDEAVLSTLAPDLATASVQDLLSWTRREVEGTKLDGTPLQLEVTICRVAHQRLVAVLRDVTEARENAARIRSFYEVLEQAPVSVVITDAQGVIQYVNKQLSSSTGYTSDEVVGKTPRIFKSGQTPDDTYRNLWTALRSGRQWRCEMLNRRKNGELFWEHQAISPLRDNRGRITQYLAVKEDITDQKEMQRILVQAMENARRANQAKSDFLAGMSHELRTPLNAVIGYSELSLLQPWGPLGDPRYREYLQAVNDSGRHLLQLINDLLDLSKVEADKFDLSEEKTNFSELLDQVILLVRERADKRGVLIRRALSDPSPCVLVDPLRLKQVLVNLLSNAIKFSDQRDVVTISLEVEPCEDLRIIVADEGCGIRESDLSRVMEPFGQADDPMVRQEVGTGLGLPLSRKLVELHGGTLDLSSVYGEGTTVVVTLPFSRLIACPRELTASA